MLEIVDADRRCLAKSDRAQVTCDLELVLVSFLHRSPKFIARDVHISLKASRAFCNPVIDRTAGIVSVLQFMHLWRVCSLAFQIWTGNVHLRSRRLAGLNFFFQLQVSVGL